MSFVNIFRRPHQPLPLEPQISLADEAMASVGFMDAIRAQGMNELLEWEARLSANIVAEAKALTRVRERIAREMGEETIAPVTNLFEQGAQQIAAE